MARAILPGDPPVDLLLRPSARARRLSLRVSGLDGRVTVSYPRHASERQAMAFAAEKADWIRAQLARRVEAVRVGPGTVLPVEGREMAVVAGPGRGVGVDGTRLVVPAAAPGAAAAAFLRSLARDRLAAAADRHAARLGRGFGRLTLRDTRSRWGSCTAAGDLMFSWRLVMAPPEVLDYVAAHEVAHLAHMHHGPAFWAEVRRLYGDHRAARGWLRREGAGLHRFRFAD